MKIEHEGFLIKTWANPWSTNHLHYYWTFEIQDKNGIIRAGCTYDVNQATFETEEQALKHAKYLAEVLNDRI